MKNEIDKDFYCSANFPTCIRSEGGETIMERDILDCAICSNKHRKHPTPEQFKEEYGEDYPDFYSNIICACTPFGKPDDDWRPK